MRNIYKLRKLYKKTQIDISALLDYPKPLYAAFEHGKYDIPPEKLKILCEYFNVSEDYLCAEIGD